MNGAAEGFHVPGENELNLIFTPQGSVGVIVASESFNLVEFTNL